MRLYEFANGSADDVETLLRNILGQANTDRIPAKIPYVPQEPGGISLSQLLNPLGYGEIDYNTFDAIAKKMQQDNPEGFEQLVKDYDSEGVTLNTKTEQDQPAMTSNTSSGKSVDQMAHNVVSKDLT